LNPLKKLVGQTAVYGLSSILGRILGYLLVPLYTRVLSEAAYGSVVELYSYIALILIVLTYGMETAFFRFAESTKKPKKVFGTAFSSIIISSIFFFILVIGFKQNLANLIEYTAKPEYLSYLALILFFDAINTIPYANLRLQNRPIRFVSIKLTGIFLNIVLNLIFILFIPWILKTSADNSPTVNWINSWYNADSKIDYIFISNVVSSGIQTLLFLPEFLKTKLQFSFDIWKKMIVFALPLLIFGLAGAINEVIDRVLLKYLLPENIAMAQVGIYGAVYKISILMTIFIQAYRYAAEPFFFAQEKHKDAKEMYANMMKYFVMVTAVIFLSTMLYMDVIIYFIDIKFRSGAHVIPILLMANLFLGIYYNLSVWYKLTNKTRFGAYISIIGAIITISLNFYWIPRIGYTGSAWATFICYGSMMIISFAWGRKHYPIPYNISRILLYLGLSFSFYYISTLTNFTSLAYKLSFNTLLLGAYLSILLAMEKKNLFPSKK